jgi:GGDEF domain-containing protein
MLSIRVRLMILAVIAILPMLVERIQNEKLDRGERIQAAYKQALDLARQGASLQDDAIVSARAFLQVVASARATFDASDGQCNQFLAKIAKPAPWLKTLSVANLQGRIVCSSHTPAVGLDISERLHFKKAVDSGGFFLSDYLVAERIQAPVITLSLAQRGANGAAAAVVIGLLDLSWFEQAARNFAPPSGSMVMIDSQGTILARYPGDRDLVGQNASDHPLVRDMLAHDKGSITDTGFDGVRRIFGYVRLPDTNARLAVGLDEGTVLARVNREMWSAFAELGGVAFLVLLCIWFGGNRLLVQPIHALTQTAARIGHGDTKVPASTLPWAAEFLPLAVAMDDMAGQLSAREEELRASNDQLRELAQIDALTGLANRRSFNERLAAEWKVACKLRQPIAVLMIDVDFFKRFNDHYGHIQGDMCLRKVGGVLMSGTLTRGPGITALEPDTDLPPSFHRVSGRVFRSDFAARYGGEEFTVLLQGADLDVAKQVGERLRQGVEDLLMAHNGAPWGFVSVSVGAAAMVPNERDNPQRLTEAADTALYRAKAQGRNCVAAYTPAVLSRVV